MRRYSLFNMLTLLFYYSTSAKTNAPVIPSPALKGNVSIANTVKFLLFFIITAFLIAYFNFSDNSSATVSSGETSSNDVQSIRYKQKITVSTLYQ